MTPGPVFVLAGVGTLPCSLKSLPNGGRWESYGDRVESGVRLAISDGAARFSSVQTAEQPSRVKLFLSSHSSFASCHPSPQ